MHRCPDFREIFRLPHFVQSVVFVLFCYKMRAHRSLPSVIDAYSVHLAVSVAFLCIVHPDIALVETRASGIEQPRLSPAQEGQPKH